MLIGRENEKNTLHALTESNESQLCVVYGRRRVGKTYLIRETFHYQFAFKHTGIYNGTFKRQLASFRSSLMAAGLEDCKKLASWGDAFDELKRLIASLPSGKKVVFIDELPWMDTRKSSLISELENFWNGWVTARPEKDVVLIVCGSATSWITKKLLQNKGGLRGRITERIMLQPFTLSECEEYVQAEKIPFSRRDITEMYMILGGIPYYWSLLKKNCSVAQNVDSLFFSRDAQLKDEFEALYHTVFTNPAGYIKVIETLGRKKQGMSRDEILAESKIEDGGTFSTILAELEQCGFIYKYMPFGQKAKGAIYQLIDNYTLFYFHCIKKNAFTDEQYWQHTYLSPDHNTWAGLAFERVCLQHIPQIKRALGISGIVSNVCSWRTKKTEDHPGVQLDLLISRGDNVVNLCEIKYYKGEYTVSDRDIESFQRKIDVFRTVTKTRKAVYLTMISFNGIAPNANRNAVQSIIVADDLFKS